MKLEAYIVNAFADAFAQGNQAGVVLYETPLSEHLMQALAFDIGKAETAFVRCVPEGFLIRWFSPLKEMPLCGHATLAAAKVIDWKFGMHSLRFKYTQGEIPFEVCEDGSIGMSFPLDDYKEIPLETAYMDFFGLDADDCIGCIQGASTRKVALILKQDVDIKSLRPDLKKMNDYAGLCTSGIAVSKQSATFDFETRYFNPWAGVGEDCVTGSVHTVLGNYWGKRLGKTALTACQCSQRPGVLKLVLNGDGKVLISGKAKIVFSGEIEL